MTKSPKKLEDALQTCFQILLVNNEVNRLESFWIAKIILAVQQFQILNIFIMMINGTNYSNINADQVTYTVECITQIFNPQEYMIEQQNIWLIPLYITLLQFIYVIYNYLGYESQNSNKQSIQKYLQNQGSFAKIISCVVNYSLLISNHILAIPFTRILLYQSNSNNIGIQIGVILTYILFFIAQLLAFLLFFESITIQSRPLQKLKVAFSDFYGLIFQQLIVIINQIQMDSNTKIALMLIPFASYYIFQIHNIVLRYSSTQNNQFLLFIYSINIGYVIIILSDLEVYTLTRSLVLILIPVLASILQSQYIVSHQEALLDKNISLAQCQFKISKLVEFETNWPALNQIAFQTYMHTHRASCLVNSCFCIKKDLDSQIKQYIRFHLIEYMVLLSQTKQAYRSFSYYLHYISAIQIIGLSSKALQQSRNLMNEVSLSTIKSMKERSKSLQSSSQTQKDEAIIKSTQYKVPKMNLIEKAKLEILYSSINQGMSKAFEKDTQNDGLQGAIQLFLQQEEKKKSQVSMISQILSDKRKFMISLQQNKLHDSILLLKQMRQISSQILLFLDQLQLEYQAFPSQKLQSALAFIYGEILNNYSKAFTISQVNTVSDERLLQLHRTMVIDLFSNKLNYMMILIDAHFKMEIKQRSQNMQRFFGYSYETFSKLTDATLLLPMGFGNAHQRLIQGFLERGESKFYQQINNNYCTTNDGYMKQVEFFYDIDISDTENLSIIAFFQNTNSLEESYIFVNTNGLIAGVSKEVLKAVGFSKDIIKQLSPIFLRKIKIQAILPEFDQIINQDLLLDITTHLNFIKPSEIHVGETRQPHWTTQNIIIFSCNVDIEKSIIEDTAYYVIKLRNIRSIQTQNDTDREPPSIQIGLKQNMDFTELDISQEDPHNLPNVLYQRFAAHNLAEEYQLKIDQIEDNNMNIISSRHTSLIDHSKQQQFFQTAIQNQANSNSFQQSFSKQEIFYEHGQEGELKKQIEEQLKQQENQEQNIIDAEDVGSQVSQLAGFKKSKFYRKYELYDKLIDSTEQLEDIKLSLIFYASFIIVLLIYILVLLIESNSDLNKFLQEINLLSIKPELYGPAQNYVSSKNAFQTYLALIFFFGYNATYVTPYYLYSQSKILESYSDMRTNYLVLTGNPLMQQFFTGVDVSVYLMAGSSSIYQQTFSFREAIDQFIFAIYPSKSIDPFAAFAEGVNFPYILYTLRNIYVLSAQFDKLTSTILSYSQERSVTVSTKWYLITITFIFLASVLQATAFYYFYQYKIKLQFILQQIVQQDQKQMMQDSINIRIVNEIIEKEPDIIYNYKFDIDRKEQLITQKLYNFADLDKVRLKDQHQRQPPMKTAIFCNIILFGSFLTYSLVQDSFIQSYISGYKPSIEFYVQMSNVSVSVGGLYTSRELIYLTTPEIFFYFPLSTRPQQLAFYESQMQVVQSFLSSMTEMPNNQILSTSTFRNQFNDVKVNDICTYLSAAEYALAKIHCLSFYNGIAKLGLQLTLNTIVNELTTEYQINQFYSRSEQPLQTTELSVIIYSVMNQIRAYYKTDLITVTNSLVTQFIISTVLYLLLNIVMLLVIIFYISQYYWIEFKEIKQSIFLVSQYTLFIDANFERRLRQFTIQNQLI